MAPSLSARAAALMLLNAVVGEGRLLSQIDLPDTMTPPEKARAESLATSVLRNVDRLDALLAPLLRKKPPVAVLNILRMALIERAAGTPDFAVVNEAVSLTRTSKKTQHMSGLVNAVLRQIAMPPALDTLAPPKLPRWIRQPAVHAYGRPAVDAIEQLLTKTPPVDITLREGAQHIPQGERLPNGSIRLHSPGQISALPGFAEGDWWVQDAAAAMAVPLARITKGERVLDLCAAPGGKTLQLCDAGARVTAVDLSASRLARLHQNLSRTGFSAQTVVADALEWAPDQTFDAILLDAPCSATGTIRRHPDLPFVKDGSEVQDLVALQSRLIDRALNWVRPGGRLIFVTCSLLPAEGEDQIAAALDRHAGLTVEPSDLPFAPAEWRCANGGLRLRPDYWADQGGMDGFYMACLRVPG